MKPSEVAYESVRPIVDAMVNSYAARCPNADREEVRSLGGLAFAKAWDSYDPDHGTKLESWVHSWLSWTLPKAFPTRRRVAAFSDIGLKPEREAEDTGFDLANLLADLSDDAATVIRLALDRPEKTKGHKRHGLVRALQGMGWHGRRIAESFSEIREALFG